MGDREERIHWSVANTSLEYSKESQQESQTSNQTNYVYQTKHVTPHMHALVAHVLEFLRIHYFELQQLQNDHHSMLKLLI